MAAREAGIWSKSVAVVFTSVVAPVLVTVITQGLKLPSESQAAPSAMVGAEERDILIGHGVGAGPDAACRDALRNALLRVIEQTVSSISAADRIAIAERILRDPQGVFVRWDRLSCRAEIVAGATRYRAEISTEIRRGALQDWLRATARPS